MNHQNEFFKDKFKFQTKDKQGIAKEPKYFRLIF